MQQNIINCTHNKGDFRFLYICHVKKFEIKPNVEKMYRNVKFLHMTDFFSTGLARGPVTYIRYALKSKLPKLPCQTPSLASSQTRKDTRPCWSPHKPVQPTKEANGSTEWLQRCERIAMNGWYQVYFWHSLAKAGVSSNSWFFQWKQNANNYDQKFSLRQGSSMRLGSTAKVGQI